jgi:Ca2+/Na+ antiporter
MPDAVILALTAVSAGLPSLATVRLQRIEHDEGQRRFLALSAGVVFLVVIGVLYNKIIMAIGILLLCALYVFMLFAPRDKIDSFIKWLERII